MSWLSADAATMLGPYLFNLRPDDVESSKEQVSGEDGRGEW